MNIKRAQKQNASALYTCIYIKMQVTSRGDEISGILIPERDIIFTLPINLPDEHRRQADYHI